MQPQWSAVVLAGGTSRRMGADKLSARVGGVTLLDRTLDALRAAEQVLAVGPPRRTARPVQWCREDPPAGGPAAAVAAGLAALTPGPGLVAVLAGDLPFLTPETLSLLLDATAGGHGAVAVDGDGREQTLLAVWQRDQLTDALGTVPASDLAGLPWRRVIEPLPRTQVLLPRTGTGPAWLDCDTPEELAAARALTEQLRAL